MRIERVIARGCFTSCALIAGIAIAMAQSGKLPDPADPGAAAPALKYESAFSDYQPFREQESTSWKQVNKEVADNPGMASMHAMKDMPGNGVPGMDSKSADEPMNKEGAGGHDMDSKAADEPMSKEGHDAMPKAKQQTAPEQSAKAHTADITGTGVVQVIDKANGKVKLTHDPIAALAWPKMTMFFRLKDNALADQVTEGDKVQFTLEKSGSGYVISGFEKGMAGDDMKKAK